MLYIYVLLCTQNVRAKYTIYFWYNILYKKYYHHHYLIVIYIYGKTDRLFVGVCRTYVSYLIIIKVREPISHPPTHTHIKNAHICSYNTLVSGGSLPSDVAAVFQWRSITFGYYIVVEFFNAFVASLSIIHTLQHCCAGGGGTARRINRAMSSASFYNIRSSFSCPADITP